MMPINMRVQLNLSKLVPVDTDDALDQNALWKMVNCYDPMHSPVSGIFSGVLASFQEGGSSVNTNLSPVYGSMDGLNLVAIPADRATIGNALKWLGGDDVIIDETSSVQELCIKFLHLLNEMDIPNGSIDRLTDFIRRRTWDETRLWGGSMAEFWEIVTSTEDEKEKWRILRVFIDSNMSWQTRVAFFAIDALHRAAVGNMAFNGLYIPGSDLKLREAVTAYVKKLVPVDESHPYLSIGTEGGKLHSIECSVKLWYCVPSIMEDDFLIRMQHTSTSIQGSQGKLTGHTIIHLLGCFLGYFHRTVTSKVLKYLYYPGDSSKGIEATLCGVPKDHEGTFKSAFREILIKDGLCDSDSWEDMAKRIEAYKKKFHWKDEAVLSSVYIDIWLEKFTKVAYETLKDLIPKFPEFTKIDDSLKLRLIPEMSLAQFQRMFQHHVSSGYPKEGSLESFRLDAHQLPIKDPMVLSVFKHREKMDIYRGDPYKKPTGGMMLLGGKVGNFPPSLVEFVWLLMYAHFSEDSFNSIVKLTQSPSTPQVTTTNDRARNLARRYLRCVIFTISASQLYSAKYWQHGYFPRDTSAGGVLVNKMNKNTQMFFLTMSAILHTCSFFQRIGINPKLPKMTEPIHDWVLKNEFEEYEKIVQDPVVMYTFFFCYQVYMQDNPGRQQKTWTKEDSCRVLDVSVRSSTGAKEITTLRKEWRAHQDEWIGNYTVGKSSTLSMSPDPAILKELSARKGYLLEVLGDDRYSQPEPTEKTSLILRPITHRISEFASWSVHYESFYEFLINSLDTVTFRVTKTIDTNVSTSTDQALAAPQGVENDGVSQKLSSIGNDATGGPTSGTSPALAPSVPQGVESEGASQELSSSGNEPTVPASSESPVQASAVSQSVENEGVTQKRTFYWIEVTGPAASTSPAQAATESRGAEDAGEGDSSDKQPSSGNDAAAGPPSGTSPAHTATDSQGVEIAGVQELSENPSSSGNDTAAGSTSETLPTQTETGSQGVEIAGEVEPSDMQPAQGSTASVSSGDIKKILGEGTKRKPSPTSKAVRDGAAAVKKKRSLGFKYVSKTLGEIVPMVIDLTESGDDEDAMEKNIDELDEDTKKECLRVFFTYLKSNRRKLGGIVTLEKEQKKETGKVATKRKPYHPCIEYESGCGDRGVSSDEDTEDTNKADQSSIGTWLERQSFNEEYEPAHRLIGRQFSSEVTETHANVGPSTRSGGKRLYSQSRGKTLRPPMPGAAIGGMKYLRPPLGGSESDSSGEEEFDEEDRTANKSHSGEGKTPESEEEEEEEEEEDKSKSTKLTEENEDNDREDFNAEDGHGVNDSSEDKEVESNSKKSSDSNEDNGSEPGHESSKEDRNDEDGNGDNHSSEWDPSEHSGNVDDVITGSQRDDRVQDQTGNGGTSYPMKEVDPLDSFNRLYPVPRRTTPRRLTRTRRSGH
jgi:hypothetical protein